MQSMGASLRKRLPTILCALAMLWFGVVVVTFSDAGVPFPTWLAVTYFGGGLTVVSILGFAVTYPRIPRNLPSWTLTFVMIVAGFTLANSSHLLRIRLYLSREALQRRGPTLAAVPADILFKQGRWIGLFHVREFAQFGSELRFITNDCGVVDNCGVVFSPDGPPPSRGEDTFSHLFGPWWHWYQSF
jgi:hypothetical protein